jgi:hypothetical protein
MSQYLTAKEVAGLLRISVKTVYKHQLSIPGRFTIGGSILWNEKVLLEAIDRMSEPAPPEKRHGVSGRHGL